MINLVMMTAFKQQPMSDSHLAALLFLSAVSAMLISPPSFGQTGTVLTCDRGLEQITITLKGEGQHFEEIGDVIQRTSEKYSDDEVRLTYDYFNPDGTAHTVLDLFHFETINRYTGRYTYFDKSVGFVYGSCTIAPEKLF